MTDAIQPSQAVEFENHVEEAKRHHTDYASSASEAVKSALLCGQSLIRARDIFKGDREWLKALARYWPEISQRRAYDFIEVAEYCSSAANLDLKDVSLREIKRLANATTETDGGKSGTVITFEASIEKWAHKLEAKKDEVLTWPDEKRAQLKEALEPIVKVYEALRGPVITIQGGGQ